jgi:hypothetical protein
MKLVRVVAAGLLASAIAAPVLAQDIDTTAPYTSRVTGFGPGTSQAYGQTFTVGTETYLNSFSLYLDGITTSAPFDYKGYIYAWAGTMATGPALFVSDVRHYAGTAPGMPQQELFDTGDLLLVSGQQYVAFLSTGEILGQTRTTTGMPVSGTFGTSPYAGGMMVADNHSNFGDLTTHKWDFSDGTFGDAWFKADFSATATPPSGGVPEPAAWGMMLGGFGLVGGALRHRRRERAFA